MTYEWKRGRKMKRTVECWYEFLAVEDAIVPMVWQKVLVGVSNICSWRYGFLYFLFGH